MRVVSVLVRLLQNQGAVPARPSRFAILRLVILGLLPPIGVACTGEITGPSGVVGDGDGDGDGDTPDGGGDGDGDGDLSAELYAADNFPRFDLDLPAESIAALEAAPDQYATATFHYGSETVTNVGVRLKGEYTFRPITAKASFKIKFDEFVADQTFRGLKRMTLNNGFEDPSLIAERMVYQSFRAANLPAPRCNNAEVWVNGELYGVYVNIETEDKTFLRRWFPDDSGNLYEEQGVDWVPGNENGFELETNETANDRSDLTALFAATAGAGDATLMTDLGAILDVPRFLRYSAMEGIVNQWDGYAYTIFGPNNYRMYHEPASGHFSVLPWGMDMSMKGVNGNDYVDMWNPSGALLRHCVQVEPCRTTYQTAIEEMTAIFESQDLAAAADAALAQIRPRRQQDPRAEQSMDEFESTAAAVRGFVVNRPAAVRAQLQ